MHTLQKPQLQKVINFFIVANSISWFMLTLVFVLKILSQQPDLIWLTSSTYFGGLILSAIIGGTLLKKELQKRKYLFLWNLSGVFSCLLLSFFYSQANQFSQAILLLLLSSSVGLGIPSCLALFSSQTRNENRGRVGAVTFLIIQLLTAIILFPLSSEISNSHFFVLSIWRFAGLVSLLFYIPLERSVDDYKTPLSTILHERRFVLLFVPWLILIAINFLEIPIVEKGMETMKLYTYDNYLVVSNIVSSIAAIPGGLICDLKGRKTAGILGFVFLGLSYALLSLLPNPMVAYALFTVFDGIAWGLLYVTFVFVVWGDLAEGRNIEGYYVLGGLPFLLSGLIQALVQPLVLSISVNGINMSFTFASFFLFLAILPLIYAPESLSERTMKERELSNYVKKAMASANKKKEKESSRDKEAKELAEKYY